MKLTCGKSYYKVEKKVMCEMKRRKELGREHVDQNRKERVYYLACK